MKFKKLSGAGKHTRNGLGRVRAQPKRSSPCPATYLDLGQVLLVGLFFNPWILGSLAWEIFGELVQVVLVQKRLIGVGVHGRVVLS